MESRNKTPLWTQDEAIAFECARELIADLIGYNMHLIYTEEKKPFPNQDDLKRWEGEVNKFEEMRRNLHVDNQAEIARIRAHYGPIVRSWYNKEQPAAAE